MLDDYPPALKPWERIFVARWVVGGALVVCGLGAGFLIILLSGSTAPTTKNASGPAQPTETGMDTARQGLARQTDLNACRVALQHINSEMGEKPTLRPPALTEEGRSWLRDNLSLNSDELKEVEASHYTRLDNHYLFRCFLMRDAAQDVLKVRGVRGKGGGREVHDKPLDQATRAFAWVMRQVRLRPAERETEPPSFVVQRGWGTALERALIFLALLDQLSDPTAAEPEFLGFLLQVPAPASGGEGDKRGNGIRLWACGVVIGNGKDVYLFDPSLGLPLPGPKGEGIATLDQARRIPEVLAQLNTDEKHRYPVTMEQAQKAQAQCLPPLSSLSPRMRYLQDKLLAPAVSVRLAGDAAKDVQRIKTACLAGAPPAREGDRGGVVLSDELCTLLRRFVSTEEGGADTTYREVRFMRELVPLNALDPVFKNDQLFPPQSELRFQVHTRFVNHFVGRTLNPGSPRDLLLRGRYRSAIEQLVAERDSLRRQVEQRQNTQNLKNEFDNWLTTATKAYAAKVTAKSPQERERADQMVKVVWEDRNISWPIHIIINSSAAVVRQEEVAYQLGLCSQEQAEQLQARLDLQVQMGAPPYQPDVEKARAAWRNALQNWQSFDENTPQQHPDRPTARFLRARAEAMLGDSEAALASWKAVASWKDEPGAPTDLERIAASYLAQQAEKKHAGKGK